MRQSHIISNISSARRQALRPRRRRLRRLQGAKRPVVPRQGAADQPQRHAGDGQPALQRGGRDHGVDYWFAEGLRNPFGGAWRDANPAAGTPPSTHCENGPNRDRLTMLVRGRDYLYDGTPNAGNDDLNNSTRLVRAVGVPFENNARTGEPSPAHGQHDLRPAKHVRRQSLPASKQDTCSSPSPARRTASARRRAATDSEGVLNPDGTRRVSAPTSRPTRATDQVR